MRYPSLPPCDVVQSIGFRPCFGCVEVFAAILLWSVAASPAKAAPVLVQHVSKDAGITLSSSLAFPANNTAGNWIGVVIRGGHSGQVFTVSDTSLNTYHQAVQMNQTLDAPNGETLAIYYAENIAGGANTVTVAESLANNTLRFAILEYSGIAASNSLDVTAAAQGSGTTLNSGTATTTVGGDLILGLVATADGVTFNAGSGYVIEERVPAAPNTKLIAEDAVQVAAGAVSVGATLSTSDNGGALLAAFKAVSGTLPPSITSLTPNNGPVGTSITIAGANFGASQGTSTVMFNGVSAGIASNWSASSITANVPSGATSGSVVVTVGGVQSNGVSFTVTPPPPSITSLSPTSGPVGTTVTIFGANFSNPGGTNTVSFNGAFASGGTWTSSYITVQVPGGATTGNVVVTVNGVASNGVAFVVTPPPTITSLSPASGLVGTSVVISGANFGASQGTSTVTFNGTPSTPTSWSATSIAVSVPAAASTGNVVVTVGGVASNGVGFSVTPSISSLNPTSGPGTISVTITGNGFGATQGGSTVTFGGIAATPISWSATSIVVPVPNNGTAGIVSVFVTVGGFASNSVNFTVTPIINTLSPTSAQVGAAVTISGTNFGSAQNSSTVTFSGIAATPISWSTTSIVVPVPTGAVTGNVVVTVGGQVSNSFTFIVTGPPPNISTITPNNGPVGTSVNIAGANFGGSQGTSTVTFNGVSAATASSWSASSITVSVPPGATTGSVIVTVGGQASDALTFTVTVPGPSISALTPNNGPVGTSVTIAGSNFGASQGTSTVTFNGVSAGTASSWSASTIAVNVPSGATTGNVVVTVSGQASNALTFTVPAPAPNISSVTPGNGPVGTSVTIAGANFGAPQGTSAVTFNGVSAGTATSWSVSSITVNVPPGATTGNVVVSVGGQTSNGLSFIVIPTISSATNNNTNVGPVGTLVTITGTNFGASQGTSTVTFNGVATTPTFWSSTSILAPVPNGAATGPVVVTVGGFASNGVNFIVTPKITGLSPSSGPLGTAVTVAGSNFGATQGSSQLTFGGVGDNPSSWSDTSLGGVTVPNLGAGTWGVQVRVGGQGSNALGFQLTPAITSLSPTSGPQGTLVTITGSSFGAAQGSNTVTFNGTVATPTSWSDSSILVAVPNGATTGNAVVTANGVASSGVNFTVNSTPTPIKFVQRASKDAGTTSPTFLAFPSANTAGNWIAVGVRGGKSGQVFTVSDSLHNTYKTASQFNVTVDAPNGDTLAIFYAENIAGGSNTVTVANSISGNTIRFAIMEYSGVALANSIDAVMTNQGTSTAPTSGILTTTANGDLLLGTVMTGGPVVFTVGSGYAAEALVPAEPNSKLLVEDQVQASAGSASAGATLNVSDHWGAVLAAFKASSSGSVGPIITGLSVPSAWIGSPITITGANFGATQGTSTVTFNGTVATPTSWSATSIVAPVPAGATTGNVVVTVGGVASNAVAFTVTPPPASISSLSPTSGPTGTSVTISGANFGASQGTSTVTFNGTSAGTATSWSGSSITVSVPSGATSGNVVVTVNGLQSNGVTFTLTPPQISVAVTPVRGGVTLTQPLALSAALQNDSTNVGVTWSASGGSLSNQTALAATFSATAAGVYTITATSKADVAKSASATIGVTDLVGVQTWRNDNSRSGINSQEYALTTQNVTTSSFGRLFSCPVDGQVYAQPLWMASVSIGGVPHNVVYVATENDSLYAFDADGPGCKAVWSTASVSLIPSGEVIVPFADVQNDNALGSVVGITGTPVIDPASQTIYLVAFSESSSSSVIPRLHAIDITTGKERPGSPVVISASVGGASGYDNAGGTITFAPKFQKQRPALLLLNGVVYIAWAGFLDTDFYHGWVMGYDATTLAQVTVFNDTIDGGRGGIWMAGGGPAADSQGNIYLLSGNGDFNANVTGGRNYGDTFLKLGTSGGLSVSDWFTPHDQSNMAANDLDLGGGSAVVLLDQPSGPFPHLVVGGSKGGMLYVVNRDNLGHFNATNDSQIVQSFLIGGNGIYSAPLLWQNTLYATASGTPLSAFPFSTGTSQFQTTPSSTSSQNFGYPGTTPVLSSAGTANAILWALQRTSATTPAVLHAYDPANLKTELWNSSQAAGGRDQAGNAVRFFSLAVANGKVYIGTQTELDVYGLLPN